MITLNRQINDLARERARLTPNGICVIKDIDRAEHEINISF